MFKSRKELREKIVELENLVTELRDSKIEAQISESRAQSGFNAQQEADRARNEVMIANLKRQIEVLQKDFDYKVEITTRNLKSSYDKQLENDKTDFRNYLKKDFSSKVEILEKQVKSLESDNAKNSGLYNGALLVIKSLETQLTNANNLSNTLIKALPQVSAAITTPNSNVVVGSVNKS